jgi:hypothetical protein
MPNKPKDILHELVGEVYDELDEMTATGAIQGYQTPFAFRGKRSKSAVAARSIPGGKVVGKEDESDDTTIQEKELMVRRTLDEGRYSNFKHSEVLRHPYSKVCYGISEAKKMIREVEFLMNICERLKGEAGVDKSQLWKRTRRDLAEINQRTRAVARRVYRIGKS